MNSGNWSNPFSQGPAGSSLPNTVQPLQHTSGYLNTTTGITLGSYTDPFSSLISDADRAAQKELEKTRLAHSSALEVIRVAVESDMIKSKEELAEFFFEVFIKLKEAM